MNDTERKCKEVLVCIAESVKNAIEIDDVKLQKECLKNIQFLAKTTAEKLQ